MTGSVNSRQVLTMDESAASVSFGKKNGCYVNRLAWVLLLVLFISALVATGLLVYYYTPNMRQTAAHLNSSETNANTYDVMTKAPPSTMRPSIVTTTSAPPSENVKDVRLPRSLKPIKYVVKLRPLLSGNFTIFGNVEVEMEAMYNTNNITLHIAAITTKNETVKVTPAEDRSGPGIRIIKQVYDNQREFYIAHLGQTLLKGRKYVLSMDFIGYLNDELRGFYRASYKDRAGTDKFMATTQFQPTDARRAFPCFDEPAIKAKFEIHLGRETSKTSLTNMPRIDTMPIEGVDGWVWDHYDTSVPMSTYLVAFVVSDFKMMETKTKNDVGYRVWARDAAIDQAKYALETGPPVLTFFEDYFNISYPLPKQDMIALTDFSAGAMENWGLITYRETAMLYDPAVSSASNKQRIAIVIAHELAHQWFGNLVTPSWWTDLWLNEGFASYMEYLGTDHVEPHWQMMEQFLTIDLQSVFALDCLESSHPISIPVNHPDEINEIFDKISYSKGASVIRMMSHFLTEATFRRGLTNYLNKLAYDSAEQDDLWMYLTNAAHGDGTLPRDVTVKMIMDTWTLQMGYPVIKVTRSSDGRQAKVSQERFLMVKNGQLSNSHVYRWWVPLTYTSQNNPDFASTQPEQWMKATEAEMTVTSLPAKDQWVIFNIQETGYYRVNYDEDNWNLLIRQLNQDHTTIHVNNRAQLINDAFNLARAGQLSYRTALGVIGYLAKEKSYVPVSSALSALDYLVSMFKRHGGYGALKSYMLSLVIPLYNSVGFQDQLSDPHLDQFKRVKALSWACSLGHQECIDQATNLFKRWMANPEDKSIISANLKNVVYCNAVAAGGEEEWNFGWRQYLASNVATEKVKLLYALGCTKKLWMLSRYLNMAFTKSSKIRKQDAGYVFRAVAGNDLGREMAWSYLRNNWLHILQYYGSGIFTLPRLIGAVTTDLNTEEYLKEIREFKSVHGASLGTAKRAVDQGEERTINNVAWANANSEVIVQWLEDNGYSSKVPSIL